MEENLINNDSKMINPKYDLNRVSYAKRLWMVFSLFFKLGIVNFGGGYALLPLLSRELCDKRGWATDEELANYYAVGQCTPGAIAVNVSTFIGYKIAGVLGGILATIGFVSPAFIIIFVIATVLTNFMDNSFVINALAGINVVVFVLILYSIVKLSKKSITDKWGLILAITVGILAIVIKVIPLYAYVIFAAGYGILVSHLKDKKELKNIKPKEENININQEEASFYDDNSIEEDIVKDYQEEKEEYKVEQKKIKKQNVIYFISGLGVGLLTGIIGYFSFIFVKNKKYREGLIGTSIFWVIMLICTLVLISTKQTVYYEIYFNFFRIGICAFGGGLATLPFLKELGEVTDWFTNNELVAMLAVSESTPGAMGINMSTYVGFNVCIDLEAFNNYGLASKYVISFIGSIISTLGIVTPSIIVILIISLFLEKFNNNKYVKRIFYGLRAASIGLIIAAAYSVLEVAIFKDSSISVSQTLASGTINNIRLFIAVEEVKGIPDLNFFKAIASYFEFLIDWKCLAFASIMAILVFKLKKHPVIYIFIGAVVGILFQMGNVSL